MHGIPITPPAHRSPGGHGRRSGQSTMPVQPTSFGSAPDRPATPPARSRNQSSSLAGRPGATSLPIKHPLNRPASRLPRPTSLEMLLPAGDFTSIRSRTKFSRVFFRGPRGSSRLSAFFSAGDGQPASFPSFARLRSRGGFVFVVLFSAPRVPANAQDTPEGTPIQAKLPCYATLHDCATVREDM